MYKPSTTRYCRPFKLKKKQSFSVQDEVKNVKSQIAKIKPRKLEKYLVFWQNLHPTWSVRHVNKAAVDKRRLEIQGNLRKEMCILVNIAKPGSGNTNNGNTASKFFLEPKLAS